MLDQIVLAWGLQHPDWDKALLEAVDKATISSEVKSPCKNLPVKVCLAQTISIMAQYESGFKPMEKYVETFSDAKGNRVISRGLLQLSYESANQKAYNCNIKVPEDLHLPKTNIECAVNIAVHWLNKDKVFFGGDKLGIGKYWSVGRKSSKSQKKIIKYLGFVDVERKKEK